MHHGEGDQQAETPESSFKGGKNIGNISYYWFRSHKNFLNKECGLAGRV